MKIHPRPFDVVYSCENLYLAWYKVSKGKTKNTSIINFYRNLDQNLALIAQDLRNGTYIPGPYNQFLIKDPKERIISASAIRDRVVQHALMNLYDPVFDRSQIFDSYACRRKKGTQKSVLRAFHFSKCFKTSGAYFLKMDVRKYFNSIDHEILKRLISKIIKDGRALQLFTTIIDSKNSASLKGIPIGNLTSQYFANHYLAAFDHYLKEKLHVKKYIRYMDDMLIFSDSKTALKSLYQEALNYTAEKLNLTLKPAIIDSADKGAPFLGFLIKPRGIFLQKKSKKRYVLRLKEIEQKRGLGLLSDLEAGIRITAVSAHLLLAQSRNFRNSILGGRVPGN
ncbi:MAG: RNA-directed DNA polymerase [Treponema sp.]|jgi:retron-type reverse transcriptase|nr:RNA-directed DNA polymerase [Treponema sp.]